MDGFVTPSRQRVKQVLEDQDLKKEIVDHNCKWRQFYSYSVVRSNLRAFISVLRVLNSYLSNL